MSDKYLMLMYVIHSLLETNRKELEITETTTVENFRESEKNNSKCLDIHNWILENFKYELSWNQIANGINILLKNKI